LKKALIHDLLVQNGGAEKCLESFTNIWDDFDIFSLMESLTDEERQKMVKGKDITTSFIQNLPFANKLFRHYFFLYPFAVEQFDFTGYDLILSSSSSVCKGILTRPDQIHISYVHSPVRYAWDLYHQYLKESNLTSGIKSIIVKWMLHYMRNWDAGTANRPDYYIANSKYVAKRIKKLYNKDAIVIHPPVNCTEFVIGDDNDAKEYYFTASRMVPYKKINLIVEAFSKMPSKKLIVVGDGPDFKKLKAIASGNIEFLGYASRAKQIKYTQNAKAFIFAAEEDFGIAPIEAQACGIPVIAFGKGGALETIIGSFVYAQEVKAGDTGIFFEHQSTESLMEAVQYFEQNCIRFSKDTIRQHALKFDVKCFEQNMKAAVESIVEHHER
jgi:glycosyltransferase involved in cell wall biosynthesis